MEEGAAWERLVARAPDRKVLQASMPGMMWPDKSGAPEIIVECRASTWSFVFGLGLGLLHIYPH